jgi:two-component system OmpR family response regulator
VKILVVEDNQKFARFVMKALSEEGHVPDLVTDGATALMQVQSIPYDLVILDWMLPELDGLQVCRGIRQKGVQVPILMLTARAEVAERIAGLDAGADDYLPKPFDLGEFLARVRSLGRRSHGSETILRVGPLTLDVAERTATIDGRDLDFTPRELALMACLARNAGRAVSRTTLLAKVWQTTFDPGSNVVEVHIRNVREKLADYAPMIETVRGVGYRLSIMS